MKAILRVLLGLALTIPALGQTVRQGDATATPDPNEFHSPMVIETIFAPADPSRWVSDEWTLQNPKRWRKGAFTLPEYHDLGKFFCDGVPIRMNFSKRQGMWDSGLSMKLRQLGSGKAEVLIRASVENSGLIHDKIVTLRLEVVNGDEVVGTTTITIRSSTSWKHSTNDDSGEAKLVLATESLRKDPITKLRITMTTKDY